MLNSKSVAKSSQFLQRGGSSASLSKQPVEGQQVGANVSSSGPNRYSQKHQQLQPSRQLAYGSQAPGRGKDLGQFGSKKLAAQLHSHGQGGSEPAQRKSKIVQLPLDRIQQSIGIGRTDPRLAQHGGALSQHSQAQPSAGAGSVLTARLAQQMTAAPATTTSSTTIINCNNNINFYSDMPLPNLQQQYSENSPQR